MKKPKTLVEMNIQRVKELVFVLGVVGGLLTMLNFKLMTPADALEINTVADSVHVDAFQHHVDDFGTYLAQEELKQESRNTRTEMVEAQMRITCLETRVETLALANLMATCDSLGVRR